MLPNGNLAFTSGGLVTSTGAAGQSIEVLPNGTKVYVQQISEFEYRSYFESTLYSADILDFLQESLVVRGLDGRIRDWNAASEPIRRSCSRRTRRR